MWLLTNKKTDEFYHLIPTKLEYSVGRAGTDIIIRNNSSISRSHAKLLLVKVATENDNDDAVDNHWNLQLQDLKSKFGTFHNENTQSIKPTNAINLKSGDRIRFGIIENLWQVENISMITMISSVPATEMKDLVKCMQSLGGKVVAQWSENCTHLTMSEITVTVKLLHALLEQLPIVNCKYWQEMLLAAKRRTETLPLAKNYLPKCNVSLMENQNINFGAEPARKSLFTGIIFIFMSRRHCDMYGSIVEKAGGITKDLNSRISKAFMIKKNVVVIQYVPTTQSQSSQTIDAIEEHLEKNERRVIPEYEIGLAILHCSIEKYCNPSYKLLNDIIPTTLSMDSNTPTLSDIYDTIPTKNSMTLKESCVVEETKENESLDSYSNVNNINSAQTATTVNSESDAALIVQRSLTRIATAKEMDIVKQPTLRVKNFATVENQKKRKHQTANSHNDNDSDNDDDDDDDDDNVPLFNLAKRANLSEHTNVEDVKSAEKPTTSRSMRNTTQKKSPKPLPIEFISKRNTRANVNTEEATPQTTFYKKTTPQKTTPTATPNKRQAPKRKRVNVLDEIENEDNDDLFSFGEVTKAQQTKKSRLNNVANNSDDDDDDDLFCFPTNNLAAKTTDVADNAQNIIDCDDANNNKTNTQILTYAKPLAKPKSQQPQKVSTIGWLSYSIHKMNVKVEQTEVKKADDEATTAQEDIDESDIKMDLSIDENKAWINKIKNALEVRVCAAPTAPTATAATAATKDTTYNEWNGVLKESDSSTSSNSGKNFKNFKKKYQKPQKIQRAISVVSVSVMQQ